MMYRRLLWRSHSKLQIAGAITGSLLGLFLLLISIQLFLDVSTLLSAKNNLLRSEFIIIHKQVSILNTLSISRSGFSQRELDTIRTQKFVRRADGFLSSNFRIILLVDVNNQGMHMGSEVFFESVPDKYLDIESSAWKWNQGDKVIPVILPSDYLALYNFGFAPGHSMPQISKDILQKLVFQITLSGGGKTGQFTGKIAGLSDRINTVLVPESFLRWARNEYGSGKAELPSRVIMETADPSNPELLSFMKAKGYETNPEKLRSSKLNLLLNASLASVGFIGSMLIFLSVMIFIISLQLVISRSSERIRLLIQLGVKYTDIIRFYALILGSIIIIIHLAGTLLMSLAKGLTEEWFLDLGFAVEPGVAATVLMVNGILLLVLLAVNLINIRIQIRRLL